MIQQNSENNKEYIGDGVYVSITDGMLLLETERLENGTNYIYLEPKVLDSLFMYLKAQNYILKT